MAEDETTGGTPETENGTFEAWLESQPEEVKTRFEQGTQGLRSALKSERDNVKALSKQISDLQEAAEKGSELETKLTALQDKLRESERHAAFMDSANGAGCSNAKAAYKLAKSDPDLWKNDGSPDWESIKATAPELFGAKQPSGHAGSGTGTPPDAGGNKKDDWIRSQRRRP